MMNNLLCKTFEIDVYKRQTGQSKHAPPHQIFDMIIGNCPVDPL